MPAEPHPTFDRVSAVLDRLAEVSPERWTEVLAELPTERERALVRRLARQELVTRGAGETTLLEGGGNEAGEVAGSVSIAERFPDLLPAWPADDEFAPYELLRRVGEGGMGQVYEALRVGEGFRQRVALKILPQAAANHRAEERFVRESEVLAGLEHPGIARFIDAGRSRRGTLFYAMEFVEGDEITAACDGLRLDLRERVRVFLQVCAAVAAAHHHLVLHRDLKPGNVLMTSERVVKLVDFGIAKLLDAELSERTGGRAFTPGYAAPEQMLGRTTSTGTDVYCLGLILFELVVGVRARRWREEPSGAPLTDGPPRSPVPGRGEWATLWASLERGQVAAIEEARGANARQIETFVRGDLGNILRRALAWEPVERYTSVDALAADLEALLENRPVSATRRTVPYVVGRLLRRHRTTALIVGFSAGLALSGAVGTIWQGLRAQRERDRVVQVNREIGAVSDFLVRDLLGAFSPDSVQSRQVTLAELADSAAASLESRPDTPSSVRRRLHLRIAELYLDLGEHDAAAAQLSSAAQLPVGLDEVPALLERSRARLLIATGAEARALEELQQTLQLGALSEPDGRLPRAELELLQAKALGQLGNWSAAEQRTRLILASLDEAAPGDRTEAFERLALDVRGELTRILSQQLRAAEAIDEGERLLADQRRLLGDRHPDLVSTWNVLTRSYVRSDRHDAARVAARTALDLAEAVFGEDHPRTLDSLNFLGWMYNRVQEYPQSLEAFTELERRAGRSLGRDATIGITALMNRGVVLTFLGDNESAIRLYREAVGRFLSSIGEDHPSTRRAQRNLMSALRRAGRDAEADEIVEELIRLGHRHANSADADPSRVSQFANDLGVRFPDRFRDLDAGLRYAHQAYDATEGRDYGAIVILARLQHAVGRGSEALDLLTVASELPDAVFTYSLERNIIDFALAEGDPDRGLALLRRIQERRGEERTVDDSIHGVSLRRISELLRRAGRLGPAGEEASAAIDFYIRCCGPESLEVALGHRQLGRVLIDQGRITEAEEQFSIAAAIYDTNPKTSSVDRHEFEEDLAILRERQRPTD